MARGDIEIARDVRVAQTRAKRKVVKKAPPKKRTSSGGIAGVSVSVARGKTTPKAVVKRTVRAGRPAPAAPRVDPIDAILAKYDRIDDRSRRQQPQRPVSSSGLSPEALNRLQLLNNNTPDSFIGGLLKNTARGALDTVTGLPAAGQLIGENFLAFNPVVGPLRFVPGLDPVRDYQNRVAGLDKRAAVATKDAYVYKYGPAFRGDFGTTGRRIYEDPLGTAFDVALAYGAAGRAGNIASKAARFAAPESQAAARVSRRLSIASKTEREAFVTAENAARQAAGRKPIPFAPGEGGRYRPPKRYVSEANAKGGRTATAEAVVERGPYSANAITRGVQRRLDRVRPRVQARVEKFATGTGKAQSLRAAAERFTQQRRFEKHQGRAAREIRYMAERRTEAMIASTPEYQQFVKATRRLHKDKTPANTTLKGLGREELAVSLHLDDLVNHRAGLSAVALRDRAVANWSRELAKFEKDHGPQPNARLQLERIKQIPEEYLTLAGDSPAVQRIKLAVQAGRDLDRVSQNRSVAAGVVTRETAEAAKARPSAVILGEAEWMPSMLKRLKDEGVGKTGRREAVTRDFERNPPPGWHEARAAVQEAENDVRIAREASPVKLMAATRKLDKAKARLKRIEERGKQRIAQPPRPELVGTRAVYRPAMTSEPARKGGLFKPSRGMSGPQKVKQSHGTLQRTGTYDMNPALLAHQARRAAGNLTGPMSARALNELIDTAAYKLPGKDGTKVLARGKRAYQIMANSPDKVVLVNAQSLKKALAKLDRLEEGKFLDDVDVKMFYGKPKTGQDWLRDLEESKVSNQYVAISRAAAEEWRRVMSSPDWIKPYDNALDLWKGGLLALSPRWYIVNVMGLAFQYGIAGGADLRSLVRAARSPEIRRAIAAKNPDVAVSTLADELTAGIDAAKIENAGAVMSTIRRGFKINNNIEAFWRRGLYVNRAKKMLRDEGGRFRKMTDEDIAAAIDRMPESVARRVVSDVDFYIGEYGRYRALERDFIKRVVPFYSWLRVIGRLTLGLPFRSPLRAAAMAVLSKAATAGLNPNDYQLPAYARGSFSGPGGLKIPTWSINPFQTVTPFLEGVGEGNAVGGVAKASVGWLTPVAQLGLNQGLGLNNFGEGVFAPPGAGGTVQQFGRDPQEMNPVTGLPQDASIRIPWSEAFIQTAIPGIAGPLRRALVGERTAYDTTTLQDLLGLTGKPDSEKFYTRSGPRARQPTTFNPFTSYFGIPTYRQDNRVVEQQYLKKLRDFEEARRQTERRKRKTARSG